MGREEAAAGTVALLALWDSISTGQPYSVLNGNVVVDGPAFLLQALILVVTFVSLLVIADRSQVGDGHFAAAAAAVPGSDYEEVTRRAGLVQTEVYPLVLFAAGGMGLDARLCAAEPVRRRLQRLPPEPHPL